METTTALAKPTTVRSFFESEAVKNKFNEMLGKRAPQFITSVLQIVASNELLKKAEPSSIYQSASVAATLDLPINNNLGFAYIVPFNNRQKDGSYKTVAQFQIGYKGFIQLAQRSGQFKTISSTPIYEGQIVDNNPLTGYRFDFKTKKSDVVIGYAAYFSLINGFEKMLYLSIDELRAHGLKYSQTFKNEKTRRSSLWENDFNAMAQKTVIKMLLSKFAPLSVEMQKAVVFDQGEIKDADAMEVEYVDNEALPSIDKVAERITLMINDATTVEDLEKIAGAVDLDGEQLELFNEKMEGLKNGK